MKRLLYIIACIVLMTTQAPAQTQITTAHKIIDIENAFAGTTSDYTELNNIIEKTTKNIKPMLSEKLQMNRRTAIKVLWAIHRTLIKEGFKYKSTDLLTSALTYCEDDKCYYSDCDTYSYIYYSILADVLKQDVVLISRWGHMYVRWNLPNNKYVNWETTVGVRMVDQEYSYLFDSKYYNELISSDQVISSVYYTRGVINNQNKQYQEAVVYLTKAIEMGPFYPDYYNERGIAQYKLGNCKDAIADYTNAITINQDEPAYYGNRAVCRARQEDYQGAYDDFGTAIDLGGENDTYYYEARITLRKNMKSLSFAGRE
jgi:tetratricopeptide (TPR) repeat protein